MPRPTHGASEEVRTAIRRTAREIVDDGASKRPRLMALVRRVWGWADEGQPWAVQELFNRLDGRPAQQLAVTVEDHRLPGPVVDYLARAFGGDMIDVTPHPVDVAAAPALPEPDDAADDAVEPSMRDR